LRTNQSISGREATSGATPIGTGTTSYPTNVRRRNVAQLDLRTFERLRLRAGDYRRCPFEAVAGCAVGDRGEGEGVAGDGRVDCSMVAAQ